MAKAVSEVLPRGMMAGAKGPGVGFGEAAPTRPRPGAPPIEVTRDTRTRRIPRCGRARGIAPAGWGTRTWKSRSRSLSIWSSSAFLTSAMAIACAPGLRGSTANSKCCALCKPGLTRLDGRGGGLGASLLSSSLRCCCSVVSRKRIGGLGKQYAMLTLVIRRSGRGGEQPATPGAGSWVPLQGSRDVVEALRRGVRLGEKVCVRRGGGVRWERQRQRLADLIAGFRPDAGAECSRGCREVPRGRATSAACWHPCCGGNFAVGSFRVFNPRAPQQRHGPRPPRAARRRDLRRIPRQLHAKVSSKRLRAMPRVQSTSPTNATALNVSLPPHARMYAPLDATAGLP